MWDWEAELAEIDPRLLESSEGRRAICETNPLLFALTYLSHHLKDDQGQISFGEHHQKWFQHAKKWMDPAPGPREYRDAYLAPRSSGKALALDTPVLTENRGWTVHGDLVPGDRVFDENGVPCRITAVSPRWENRPCYRITFRDGTSIVADENHEWLVQDRYRSQPAIEETHVLVGREDHLSIPVTGPVQFEPKSYEISPYVLGAWLGDGTSAEGCITAGEQDFSDMQSFLSREGEDVRVKKYTQAYRLSCGKPRPDLCPREHPLVGVRPGGRRNPCRVCIKAHNKGGSLSVRTNRPLKVRLRDLGVLNNKHIPRSYLEGSVEQRIHLLQGLMDTDGCVNNMGSCEYTGTNERLVQDVLQLVRSLGIKATIREGSAYLDGREVSKKWVVSFTTTLLVFRLARKQDRLPTDKRVRSTRHYIESVERVENQTTSCISVDSPSHLYLAGDSLVPTHNSTFWFLILPMWWAAYGYSTFLAAFADSGGQAELHLLTFKTELEDNDLLRQDFPDLCAPKRRARGSVAGDAKNIRLCANGFIFMAKGVDSSSLGMKIGAKRPDTILLDDIEPDETNYSLYQMDGRLETIQSAILPLNERARTVLSGTVTMPGSITHQLIKKAAGWVDEDNAFEWIEAQNFNIHHQMPILEDAEGARRSCWPAKWPLEYLERIEHTRDYQKNFLNNPMAMDSDYWHMEDFTHGDLEFCSSTILSIDGAVTTKAESDYTGLAVVGYSPAKRSSSGKQPPQCVVKYARGVKLKGEPLRRLVINILESFPEIRGILVETNQGGDMWLDTLHGMPVKIFTVHNTEKKESRAGRLLNLYQMQPTRVVHAQKFPALEEQMISFPVGANDDLVDAVGNAVLKYLRPEKRPKAGIKIRQPR